MSEPSRTFTLEEAQATFPSVRRLTAQAVARVEKLVQRFRTSEESDARDPELESRVQRVVAAWAEEIQALGCEVKGLWLVDWDSGDGYFCWRWPEASIAHFHGYEDGFAGRLPIN